MPQITQWGVEVDIDIDVDVAEFYDGCSDEECRELVKLLEEDRFITPDRAVQDATTLDHEWNNVINKLAVGRVYLTLEEEAYIKQLINKIP